MIGTVLSIEEKAGLGKRQGQSAARHADSDDLQLLLTYHEFCVHCHRMMKNITLSVDEAVIVQARKRAAAENTTINELFRAWIERYAAQPSAAAQYLELMKSLSHVKAGRKYTREEMNERR